jgi:glucosyl-3-phosphoglycerate phosphatase
VTKDERGTATRLILWRHGNTDWNSDNRVQGQTDTPLNAVGQRQAAATAPLLAAVRPDAIITSDLSRASATADALVALTELTAHQDQRLREREYGLWQGLTMAEIAERFPAEHRRWRAGEQSPGCGIESLDDLGKRVAEVLQEAADALPGGTTVLVTHGGALRQGCGTLLGWPTPMLRTIGPVGNCHWAELRHDNIRKWQLWSYNVGA